MTEKQKEAIKILNRVRNSVLRSTCGDVITEEEYFTLLEFVIGNESLIQYIPYCPQTTPFEGSPTYEQELKTTCENESTNHLDNNNY